MAPAVMTVSQGVSMQERSRLGCSRYQINQSKMARKRIWGVRADLLNAMTPPTRSTTVLVHVAGLYNTNGIWEDMLTDVWQQTRWKTLDVVTLSDRRRVVRLGLLFQVIQSAARFVYDASGPRPSRRPERVEYSLKLSKPQVMHPVCHTDWAILAISPFCPSCR
jgi:hypothetical protein